MRRVLQRDIPESPFLWARGTAARETLRYLDKNGIDAEPMLSSAGLSRSQLSQQRGGVSVASQCRFLELAAVETSDALLGLHVAAEMDLRDSGVLFYLMASSATVAEALERLARYAATTNEAVRIEISRHNVETVLTAHFLLGVEETRRQAAEFLALAIIRALHRETNRDFAPSRVTFVHARNSNLREIHRLLRCPVEFAHATGSLAFPQSVMELPIISQDSRLLQILEAHSDDLLSERHTSVGLRGLVEDHLRNVLPSGKVQAAVVAQQLGMSTRSFTRRLAQEGTTFGEILDRLRNRLALGYLEDQRMSLQQIAWLLGYSEGSAFNHAFKRWFGTSPRGARNQPALTSSAQQNGLARPRSMRPV
jgi:AraC-like DNA-binding protein